MTPPQNPTLLCFDLVDLITLMEDLGEPKYRAQQIFDSIYRQRTAEIDLISNIPKDLRTALTARDLSVGQPHIDGQFSSVDGTIRYLVKFPDGQTVETVWMPEGDDGEFGDGSEAGADPQRSQTWNRATICVSSQVGCAVDCQFCLTALLKMKRNLTAGEIVGQVIAVLNERKMNPPEDRINLVFMGMGEPFLNYDNFTKAVRLLVQGVGIPASRMTVSTAGIVPRIHDLGNEATRPKLAISLNAPNDELRDQIMPINRKWNLEKLMDAARKFPLRNREKLTFEYVLLNGVNDEVIHARQVAELVRGMRVKINLIALNPGPGIAFGTPASDRVEQFQRTLINAGIPAFIRRPRGRDIFAACGQLKKTTDSPVST